MKFVCLLISVSLSLSFAITSFPQAKNSKVELTEAYSPYLLETGFILGENDTLEIGPGVAIYFGGYAKLYLRGTVRINGTAEKPISFLSADLSESWNGLYIASGHRYFYIKYLIVENAFRNTVIRSSGIFEHVKFVNNYYGLWAENSPMLEIVSSEFVRNRFAVSVGVGKIRLKNTKIHDNIFGLYLYRGTEFEGDADLIKDNLEADIREETDEFPSKTRKISRNIWQRLESGF